MIEATRFLRWDGVCRDDAKGDPGTCNANGGGVKPTVEDLAPLELPPSSQLGSGGMVAIMRFEIDIVRVEPAFLPGKEYVPIRARFKGIDEVTSMVLQIRDQTGKLVYCERLAAAQVWGLPEIFDDQAKPPPPVLGGGKSLATRDKDPYQVTLLCAKNDADIPLDTDRFKKPPTDVHRNPDPAISLVGAMSRDRTRVRSLVLESVDHHFAPSRTELAERLQIKSHTVGLSDRTVKIRVTSDSYPHGGGLVYEADLASSADGDHTDLWNGLSTAGAGPLQNKLIHPLYGPYKIKLVVPDYLESEEKTFHVLYHSVSLERGSYIEDPATPPAKAQAADYVQYKLNELGYFAGPVKTVMTDQGKRALKRYTYNVPFYSESDNIAITSMDVSNTPVIDALDQGRKTRAVFSHPACLGSSLVASRIYVDHNYFYHNMGQFGSDTGHTDCAQHYLDRFEVPLRAKVYLMSRADADGTGVGVLAGEAAGDVEVGFRVIDPPEDLSDFPAVTADSPSATRAYIEKVRRAKAVDHTSIVEPVDNCPAANNRGVRGNENHFLAGTDLPPFTTRVDGHDVLTKVHQDPGGHPHQVGAAAVLFRASNVAGDNYVVEASIRLDKHARAGDLGPAHETALGPDYAQSLRTRTGKMTLWRRYAVTAMLDWPGPSPVAINWASVEAVYRRAHVELDTSNVAALTMANVINGGMGNAFNTMMLGNHYTGDHPSVPAMNIAHNDNCVYSGPALPVFAIGGDRDAYKDRIDSLLNDYLTTDHLGNLATVIRTVLMMTEESGQITMRVNWCEPVHIPMFNHLNQHVGDVDHNPKLFCIGLAYGVTMLPNAYLQELDDHFVVAHEIGHCMFLRHHETTTWVPTRNPFKKLVGTNKVRSDTPVYDNPTNHDKADHNCTMSYPWGIVTRNPPATVAALSWDRGTTKKPYFCGKCVLKLRGWEITGAAGLPDDST
jgi:hypothetical protein